MKFIGAIAFLDSAVRENDGRMTQPMTFTEMSAWVDICRDTYQQMCAVGDYDGSEILISLYRYDGPANVTDGEKFVDSVSIINPFHF